MRKHLILILALALVAGLSIAAYAEVQNVKVSGDVTVEGVARNNLTLNKGTPNWSYQDAEFTKKIRAGLIQTRVKVEADLTDNVIATVRLLNERVWGATEGTTNTDIDIDLAYVTLKEFLYSPLSVTLGRQELRYGSGLVVGDPDTNAVSAGHGTSTPGTILPRSMDDLSARKAFDAIKAVLNYDPLVVDLVWAKISEGTVARFDDTNLYGVNAAYAVNKELNTEAYLFQRNRDAGVTETATLISSKAEKLNTAGVRATYSGIKNTTLGLEGAYQFGNHLINTALYPDEAANNNGNRKVNAYAIQATVNHVMPDKKYAPAIGGSYTHLSGDRWKSTNDIYRGWDPMYEDQAGGTLFNKILGYTNMQILNVNGSLKPVEDLKVGLNYYYLMLNKTYVDSPSSINTTGGAGLVHLTGVAGDPSYNMNPHKKSLGHEVDLGLAYDYTEDVQLGLNAGAFMPGRAFAKSNDETAKQVIGSMKVTF